MDNPNGKYARQIGGYDAYVPSPLPPKGLTLSSSTQSLLSKADLALGRLDGALAIIPDPNRFASIFALKEAVLSSQIEGTNASLSDVLEYEAQLQAAPHSVDIQEVINYVDATNLGIELLATLPITGRLLKQVHKTLMNGVRGGEPSKTPGEYRRSQNWIGGATPASARYVPPPPDEVGPTMSGLEKFLNKGHNDFPPLVAAGLIHAQFETIHPFLDGNGRTGRLLIIFWLIEQKILKAPVLYPSLYMKLERDEYVRRLDETRTATGWEGWLRFFFDAIAAAATEASSVALAIVHLQSQHRKLITTEFGKRAPNALKLLDLLFKRPIVEAKLVERDLGLSQPTVSSLLNEFALKGILVETTGSQRNRRYSYDAYLSLFPSLHDRS